MSISAAQVKELRERTGAGMMECKKALQEANGDIELAIENMRKAGSAKATKRARRIAAEGIIKIKASNDNKLAAIVEVNCETDFVARDGGFLAFVDSVIEHAVANKTSDDQVLRDQFEKTRQELVGKIGENVQIRRAGLVSTEGCVAAYNHGGRIGVLVGLDKDNMELAKDVAMHIAASNPLAISSDDISKNTIEKEREIYRAQAEASGKPAEIITKMVEGRVKKFLKEVALLEQPFVKDPQKTVGQLLKESGATVIQFVRFEVGEGIEKDTTDFAKEVMEQVQGS